MQHKRYEYILALDPSGSFEEGKGCTGWALTKGTGELMRAGKIDAIEYGCTEEYWLAHSDIIDEMYDKYGKDLLVVCEDFILYPDKAQAQSYSKMETSRLIGIIQMNCYLSSIPLEFQRAVEIKTRWREDILIKEGYMRSRGKGIFLRRGNEWLKTNKHILDAYRHALHYTTFKNYNESRKRKEIKTNGFDNYR